MMWVFLNNAMISAVKHREEPGKLMVRARLRGDLEAVFPDLADKVKETPNADYRYRIVVSRAQMQLAMTEALDGIDYPDFKGSVPNHFRHETYYGVWSVMHRAQHEQHAGR
jgi:hypothetical protein